MGFADGLIRLIYTCLIFLFYFSMCQQKNFSSQIVFIIIIHTLFKIYVFSSAESIIMFSAFIFIFQNRKFRNFRFNTARLIFETFSEVVNCMTSRIHSHDNIYPVYMTSMLTYETFCIHFCTYVSFLRSWKLYKL